ncbi:MAG TPA: hypothetical protein VK969_07565 [Acidimicrobiia bacterium]|nr:hypothetical protein [Acidimicrobiia bacterium]
MMRTNRDNHLDARNGVETARHWGAVVRKWQWQLDTQRALRLAIEMADRARMGV